MIRIRKIRLRNVKNVADGEVTFEPTPAGGSVTGIYGQNGSGKTAVIESLGIIRLLLAGRRLPAQSEELIRHDATGMDVDALFLVDDAFLQYHATFIGGGSDRRLRVLREFVRIGDDERRMGREVLSHGVAADPDARGRKDFDMTPAYVWRSIRSNLDIRSDIDYEGNAAFGDSRSYLFAEGHLRSVAEKTKSAHRRPSRQALDYVNGTLEPVARSVESLGAFARADMHVSTTSKSATASYSYIILPGSRREGAEDTVYDLINPNPVTEEEYGELEDTVRDFSPVLSALVPGLQIALQEQGRQNMPDGSVRLMAGFASIRGDVQIPFRCESEGIIRLTSMLSLLVHAYNDENACVAIDEIDSGVFEYLLGQLLKVMSERAHGQLIFTAHNLRALETMPAKNVTLTTVDPERRFIPFQYVRQASNGRSRYIANVTGGDDQILYRMTDEQSIASSLYRAGHPDDKDDSAAVEALSELLKR